jgi:hypothetical protein
MGVLDRPLLRHCMAAGRAAARHHGPGFVAGLFRSTNVFFAALAFLTAAVSMLVYVGLTGARTGGRL